MGDFMKRLVEKGGTAGLVVVGFAAVAWLMAEYTVGLAAARLRGDQ